MKRELSVLHGFRPSAGQPALLAKEMRQRGIESRSVIIGHNDFGYQSDYRIDPSKTHDFLSNEASRFDVVHVHAITPFFTRSRLRFPMGTDLLALKAAGKRIVIQFRGSEIRIPSIFADSTPFNYFKENPNGVFDTFPETFQRDYISMCAAIADVILVGDPELQSYVPNSRILPRGIDLEEFPRASANNSRPLIVHAPSSPVIKGTRHVVAAVQSLKKQGLEFDFELVEGLSHRDAVQIYRRADIIVDQLRIGWYGVLAVEGMALGKAVVSYIRNDLLSHFGGDLPLANADPDSIEAVLRQLVLDRDRRGEIAERGFQYCRKVHDVRVVARDASQLYEEIISIPPKFDMSAYLSLNRLQTETLKADTKGRRKIVSMWNNGLSYWRKYGTVQFAKRAILKAAGAKQ